MLAREQAAVVDDPSTERCEGRAEYLSTLEAIEGRGRKDDPRRPIYAFGDARLFPSDGPLADRTKTQSAQQLESIRIARNAVQSRSIKVYRDRFI